MDDILGLAIIAAQVEVREDDGVEHACVLGRGMGSAY
jgi:hypothetical protein